MLGGNDAERGEQERHDTESDARTDGALGFVRLRAHEALADEHGRRFSAGAEHSGKQKEQQAVRIRSGRKRTFAEQPSESRRWLVDALMDWRERCSQRMGSEKNSSVRPMGPSVRKRSAYEGRRGRGRCKGRSGSLRGRASGGSRRGASAPAGERCPSSSADAMIFILDWARVSSLATERRCRRHRRTSCIGAKAIEDDGMSRDVAVRCRCGEVRGRLRDVAPSRGQPRRLLLR